MPDLVRRELADAGERHGDWIPVADVRQVLEGGSAAEVAHAVASTSARPPVSATTVHPQWVDGANASVTARTSAGLSLRAR
jgi:hypothetical protein